MIIVDIEKVSVNRTARLVKVSEIFRSVFLPVMTFLCVLPCLGTTPGHGHLIPGDPSNKFIIGDSIWKFAKVPWKCVLINSKGDTITRYYRRDGVEKARLGSSHYYFAAMNQGSENRDYYETYRTYKSGETKQVRNWYNYGADYGNKPNNKRYFYTPRFNDAHGNWVAVRNESSVDPETLRRVMVYYDETGFSEKEDKEIDARTNALVSAVKEQENPFNLKNIAGSAFSFGAKALYLLGLFILFMLVFRRNVLYLWIDRHAGKVITPRNGGLFCRTQLCGIIPSILILGPTGLYIYNGHTTAVLQPGLLTDTLYGIAIALAYALIYVLIRRRKVFTRTAIWELIYGTCCCICLWAAVILGIYVAVIMLIGLFFAGMLFGRGGTLPNDVEGPNSAGVMSGDGEYAHLNRIGSSDYFMDHNGNIYDGRSSGSFNRLGDGKSFY